MKKYSRKQLTEAIAYWSKQLELMNEERRSKNELFGKTFYHDDGAASMDTGCTAVGVNSAPWKSAVQKLSHCLATCKGKDRFLEVIGMDYGEGDAESERERRRSKLDMTKMKAVAAAVKSGWTKNTACGKRDRETFEKATIEQIAGVLFKEMQDIMTTNQDAETYQVLTSVGILTGHRLDNARRERNENGRDVGELLDMMDGNEAGMSEVEKKMFDYIEETAPKFNADVIDTDGDPYVARFEYGVKGTWTNDGIGAYEYWGAIGYDEGHDYLEVDSIDFDVEGFNDEISKCGIRVEMNFDDAETDDENETQLTWGEVKVIDEDKFWKAFA